MIEIVSFGYLHAPAPDADLTYDLRKHFRDPHLRPALRDLTAADPAVMDTVMATPGIPRLISAITSAATALLDGPNPAPVVIAIGCAGGRHRSAAVAITVARLLRHAGHEVTLTHRDIGKPVVCRAPGGNGRGHPVGGAVRHRRPCPEPQPAAAITEARDLRTLVAEILSVFNPSKGDGYRARVGQVQIAKWRNRAGLED